LRTTVLYLHTSVVVGRHGVSIRGLAAPPKYALCLIQHVPPQMLSPSRVGRDSVTTEEWNVAQIINTVLFNDLLRSSLSGDLIGSFAYFPWATWAGDGRNNAAFVDIGYVEWIRG